MRQRKAKKAAGEKDSILDWIKTHIAVPHPHTGAAICPFAQQTIKQRRYEILPARRDLQQQIQQICDIFDVMALDIVILYVDYAISSTRLNKICESAHQSNPKHAVLYDHPKNAGLTKGVQFSYQKKPLVMIQNLAQLKSAQQKIPNWYKAWGLEQNDPMFY